MNTYGQVAMARRLRRTWAAATDIAEEGHPITLRGLMARTGISAVSDASYHVDKLIAAGYLAWGTNPRNEELRNQGGITVIIPLGNYNQTNITRRNA